MKRKRGYPRLFMERFRFGLMLARVMRKTFTIRQMRRYILGYDERTL